MFVRVVPIMVSKQVILFSTSNTNSNQIKKGEQSKAALRETTMIFVLSVTAIILIVKRIDFEKCMKPQDLHDD